MREDQNYACHEVLTISSLSYPFGYMISRFSGHSLFTTIHVLGLIVLSHGVYGQLSFVTPPPEF